MQKEIYEYQDLDKKLVLIERELNNNEDRAKGKKLSSMKKEAEELLSKWDARIAEFQKILVTFKSNYEKMVTQCGEFQKVLEEVEDAEELAYLKRKVALLYDNIAQMQRECKNILAESEELLLKYDDVKRKLPKIEEQYKIYKTNFNKTFKEKQSEVGAIKQQMAQLAEKINPSVMDTYKKCRLQNVKLPIYVPFSNGRCGGCQMDLSQSRVTQLNEKGYIRCEHCSRIIVKE